MTGRVAVLPQVDHGILRVGRGIRLVLAEVAWWLSAGWRLTRWAPRRIAAWFTGTVFAVWAEMWSLLAGLVAVVLLLGLWARIGPMSFQRWVAHPSWRRRIRRRVRRSWAGLMEACGVSRRVRNRAGEIMTQ